MIYPVLVGAGAGLGYFAVSESGVPKEANCSYLVPASTDVFAAIGALALIAQGYSHKAPLVTAIGSIVLSIHAAQWWSHKSGSRG